ncbi:hypothetical protein [Aeromonas aquatica]|nr:MULTISPECIES: hypothetical protein [Aeromonas]MCH7372762.1 DNA polymerase III subunit delta [Aeromonas sp. MR16]
MRVHPEQFADHLKAGLKPCYLIFGDEPLLKMPGLASGLAIHQPSQVKF